MEEKRKEQILEENDTVELELDDGRNVVCEILTILTVQGKDYIALAPSEGEEDGEVWLYKMIDHPEDPKKNPDIEWIADDEEYELAADAFDEWLDEVEFEEM